MVFSKLSFTLLIFFALVSLNQSAPQEDTFIIEGNQLSNANITSEVALKYPMLF